MTSHKDLEVWQLAVELARELETQLEIASRVGLGTGSELKQLDTRSTVSKTLQGLIRSVAARDTDSKASQRP